MKSLVAAAAALSLGSTAYAAVSKQCASSASDLCFSLSIPETTASKGSGDIYFQIAASTQYEWVAMGQGAQMSGAQIFVMYQSSDGTNVTVSPRLGTGHVEPQFNSAAKITLLEGSGVSNGYMTANVLCESCSSWSGGTMDFSSSSANFIYAALSGTSIESSSESATITQHDTEGTFVWPISAAKGGSSNVNPFVSDSSSSGGNSGSSSGSGSGSGSVSSGIPPTCTPIADSKVSSSLANGATKTLLGPSGKGCPTTWPAAFSTSFPANPPAWVTACYPQGSHPTNVPSRGNPNEKRDDGCPAGYEPAGGSLTISNEGGLSASQSWMPVAHGVLASLAFVGLFPIGGIMIRLANFTGLLWVHAVFQMVAYLIYIVAFAIGVYMATHLDYMSKAHPIIGIGLFVILLLQPVAGILHHKLYKKYGTRTLWSYLHLFHGRIAIFLGMINGGLGIQLAGTANIGAKAAYAVITVFMALIYIAAIIMGELRRKRKGPPTYEKSQKAHQLRDLSSSESDMPSIRHGVPQQTGIPPVPVIHSQEYYASKENRF